MDISQGGIAFFDSGIGGLTVLEVCRKYFPETLFYYYGDNAHAPYGNRSPRQIRRYVLRAFRTFEKLNVRAAVVACNTVTATCIELLRAKFSFPIIGTEPAVCTAAMKGGKVLVLATCATEKSAAFQQLCIHAKELFPNAEIIVEACAQLAGAIERNIGSSTYDFTVHLPKVKADAVVLGCTHYIYIGSEIAQFYNCDVYDGNEGVARRLHSVLNTPLRLENQKIDKNWDGQPLCKKSALKLGRITTDDAFQKKRQKKRVKTNKCLQKMEKNEESIGTVFLGKYKDFNENIHKQMFVCTTMGKNGRFVVKNPKINSFFDDFFSKNT